MSQTGVSPTRSYVRTLMKIPLEIRIGDTVVAHGEAVKVGDKFGVRLVGITMPPERFRSLLETLSRRQASSQRAG